MYFHLQYTVLNFAPFTTPLLTVLENGHFSQAAPGNTLSTTRSPTLSLEISPLLLCSGTVMDCTVHAARLAADSGHCERVLESFPLINASSRVNEDVFLTRAALGYFQTRLFYFGGLRDNASQVKVLR